MNKLLGVLLGGVALVLSGPASAAFLSGGDLSCESSTDTGTAALDLDGAYGEYLPFSTFAANGDSFTYHLRNGTGLTMKVETGTATFTDGTPDSIARVADWSSDGVGAELDLTGTSVICIGFTSKFFTGGLATLDIEALDVDAAIVAGTNITATAGNVVATAGDVTSGDDVIVGDDVLVTDDIDFGAGDVQIAYSANDLAFTGVTGDYSFDDTVGVTGSVTASVDVTATAGDVTSGDDIISGDDVTLSAADGVISIGADVTFTRVDASDSLVINADTDNDGASTVISLGVDGNGEALLSGTAFYPGADGGSSLGINDTNEWNGAFLNSGTAVSWAAGDVTITHSANDLAFAGVTGDYSFDDSVFVTGVVDASDDVDAADDVLVGDDITMTGATPKINFTDTDTNADSVIDADSAAGSLQIQADQNNEVASSSINFWVDGTQVWNMIGTTLRPTSDAVSDIGTTSLGINNLHFDTGATTNYENGDCIWTHASNSLALTGGCVLTSDSTLDLSGVTTATLSAASADLLVEGDIVKREGTETIWIPANAISPVTDTFGQCTYSVPGTYGAVDQTLASCLYNDGSYDVGGFTIRMPKNWDEGNFSYQAYWSTSATSGDVTFKMNCIAYAENDALAGWSGDHTVADTAMGTANRLAITAASTPGTCQGTPAAGEIINFRFYRDYAVVGDTIAADVRLWGIVIFYQSDAANDD
jgi:hypothetical protein